MSDARYLTFSVASHLYALPTDAVLEVIRLRSIARVPQGPAALLGLANLRGDVVAVAGLRELLGHDAGPRVAETLALVLDQSTRTALVVDEVASFESVASDRIDSAAESSKGLDHERTVGMFQVGQQTAKILDIDALLAAAFTATPRVARDGRAAVASLPATRATTDAVRSELLLSFAVEGQEFAFPLPVVEEVLPLPASMSNVSRSDAVIMGFVAARGTLIPLLALRGLLGFDSRPVRGGEKVLVLKVAGAPVGLVADEVRSIVTADADAMEAIPAVLAARTGGEARIQAIYRGEGGRRLISILAPDELFREDVMQRLANIHSAAPRQAGPQTQDGAQTSDGQDEAIFVVFRLGDAEFGLPVESVVEVAEVPAQITRVPKTPKFLDGVVNLRGEVLPVIDQRRRFDLPPLVASEARRLVVVKTDRHRAGLLVDSVSDVLRSPSAAILPPPDLTAQISRLVYGVLNLQQSQRLVLLLDPTELITRAEEDLLDGFRASGRKGRV